jgi:hypothetical protein
VWDLDEKGVTSVHTPRQKTSAEKSANLGFNSHFIEFLAGSFNVQNSHSRAELDVCEVLEIEQPTRAAERLDLDEKGVATIDTPGGAQEMLIVSEPGLYKLLGTSRPAKSDRVSEQRLVLPAADPGPRRDP